MFKRLTRRGFIIKIFEFLFYLTIAKWFPLRMISFAAIRKPSTKIAIIHHSKASNPSEGLDNKHLNGEVVCSMVNSGVMSFTGQSDLKKAWQTIIPDPSLKVGIKVNCQITSIFTKAKVVHPIIEGLTSIGVDPDNIFIYDMGDKAFSVAGFEKNTDAGVKVGTVSDFGGYSRFLFHRMANLLNGGYSNSIYNYLFQLCSESRSSFVRAIIDSLLPDGPAPYDCAYLINVPVLKALDGWSGVTLSMKNHYGSIANPGEHHEDIMDHIPLINSLPQISMKTRLIVLDAIYAGFKWVNGRDQSNVTATNKIIIGEDPVAIDYLGWQMIEHLRKDKGIDPLQPSPLYIEKAAALEVGTNLPEKMDIEEIDMA